MNIWKRISDWFNSKEGIHDEITITKQEWEDGQITDYEYEQIAHGIHDDPIEINPELETPDDHELDSINGWLDI